MEYLIRLVQWHETFRKAEIDALAALLNIDIKWIRYNDNSPFAIISIEENAAGQAAAKALVERSILAFAVYELWGRGKDYDSLHHDIRHRTEHLWERYKHPSFRFEIDSFQGRRSADEKKSIMESLSYMSFEGPITMTKADEQFTVFEDYSSVKAAEPFEVFFGRLLAHSGRKIINKYDLKKRTYISTTSMDAELSLVTANLALAAPGKIAYDPFMGTGSFPVACAHFGAAVFGSDMDGRSIRGKKGRNVRSNFMQYGTSPLYLDGFVADITNTPLRIDRWLDVILCDPPYGVREGLKVLGSTKDHLQQEVLLANGTPAHLGENYIPPKRPYSFIRMLDDILHFAACTLVDHGRLCMWMPVAGAEQDADESSNGETPTDSEYDIPHHPALDLVSHCRQDFNKWSRRLLTYRRLPNQKVPTTDLDDYIAKRKALLASTRYDQKEEANELNAFRKKYFSGFK